MPLGNPIRKQNESRMVSVLATEGQTVFTVQGGYIINHISVFRNGVRLSNSEDFTAGDGSTVTLNTEANVNDRIEFHIFDRFTVQNAIVGAASTQTISGDVTVTGTLTGASIGISSAGTTVGAAKTLNFVGTGNTFAMDGDTVNISISGGGGGGGLGTAINYADNTASPFSYIDRTARVSESLLLDTSIAGESESIIVSVSPNIEVNAGVAVTVGAGKTMIIDVLQIGDL